MAKGEAWRGSTRKKTLPSNWPRLKRETHSRDGWRCTWVDPDTEERCGEQNQPGDARGLECDHVLDRDNHRVLTTLCRYHHQQKSASQGGKRSVVGRAKDKRPQAVHPGLRRSPTPRKV